MKKSPDITEAEWPIMKVLWERDSATASEIVEEVTRERPVSMRTVKTLIRRLVAKDMIAFTVDERDSRVYHYRARLSREEGLARKNQTLLNLVYDNNPGELLAHFVKNANLDKKEIAELQALLRRKLEE